jgi:hypothetical protein
MWNGSQGVRSVSEDGLKMLVFSFLNATFAQQAAPWLQQKREFCATQLPALEISD